MGFTIGADTVNIDHYDVVVVPVPSIKVKMLKEGLLNMMMQNWSRLLGLFGFRPEV